MLIKLLTDHKHKSNNWKEGQTVNVNLDLRKQLVESGKAVDVESDCGCGQ